MKKATKKEKLELLCIRHKNSANKAKYALKLAEEYNQRLLDKIGEAYVNKDAAESFFSEIQAVEVAARKEKDAEKIVSMLRAALTNAGNKALFSQDRKDYE